MSIAIILSCWFFNYTSFKGCYSFPAMCIYEYLAGGDYKGSLAIEHNCIFNIKWQYFCFFLCSVCCRTNGQRWSPLRTSFGKRNSDFGEKSRGLQVSYNDGHLLRHKCMTSRFSSRLTSFIVKHHICINLIINVINMHLNVTLSSHNKFIIQLIDL